MLDVKDLVQRTLEEVAPEEVILVNHFVDDVNSGKTAKGALGFGSETAIALILPIVWKIYDQIISELTKEIAQNTVGSLKKVLSKLLSIESPATNDEPIANRLTEWLRKEGIEGDKAQEVASKILEELLKEDKVIK